MQYTDNPERDADIYYLNQDKRIAEQQISYDENIQDYTVFESFIYDADIDDKRWKVIFEQMNGDAEDKVFAYDLLMSMFEDYTEDYTEYYNEG